MVKDKGYKYQMHNIISAGAASAQAHMDPEIYGMYVPPLLTIRLGSFLIYIFLQSVELY